MLIVTGYDQGSHRIIYLVDDQRREVTVFKIGHRKNVYR